VSFDLDKINRMGRQADFLDRSNMRYRKGESGCFLFMFFMFLLSKFSPNPVNLV
jgi:hypothetical protein